MSNNSGGKIWYGTGIDNSQLVRDAEKTKQTFRNIGDSARTEGDKMQSVFSNVLKGAAAVFTIQQAAQIVSSISKVRGEFQQLEVAFRVMLGSQEKATKLMAQLTETAARTPFDLQGIAGAAKQLLAYGFAAEEVNETIIRLGNVASALNIPMGDMAYLYGTTMTQGRMFTQDLRQFMGRGIPVAEELAKQFGVTKDKVSELVSEGKVGFPQIKLAIEAMTSEGGKFYNMMEESSKQITGLKSNRGDAIDMMLNDLGKKLQPVLEGSLKTQISIVENYKEIGKILLEIAAVYGTYRAALIAVSVVEKINLAIKQQAIVQLSLAKVAHVELSRAQILAAARSKLLAGAMHTLTSSIKANTAAMLSNPYVLVAAAFAAMAYVVYKTATQVTDLSAANKRLSDATEEVEENVNSEIGKLAALERKLAETKKGTKEFEDAKAQIVKGYGKYFEGLDKEIDRVGSLRDVYDKLVVSIRNSMGERKLSTFFEQEQNNLDKITAEKLDKAYEELVEKHGKNEGMRLYQAFYDSAIRGTELIKADRQKLRETGFTEWGFDDSPLGVSGNNVERLLTELYSATRASNVAIDKYKKMYGISDEKANEILFPVDTTAEDAARIKAEEEAKRLEEEAKLRREQEAKLGKEKADRLAKERADRLEKLKSLTEDEVNLVSDLESKVSKSEIDAMDEGLGKELAQLEFNHEEKKRAIIELSQNMLDTQNEIAKNVFVSGGGSADNFSPTTKLSTKNAANIEVLNAAEDAALLSGKKRLYQSILDEYQTFDEKRKAIDENYQKDFDKLISLDNGKNSELIQSKISVLTQKALAARKGIDEEELDKTKSGSDLLIKIFTDTSNMSQKRLKETLDYTKKLVDYLKGVSSSLPEGITQKTADGLKGKAEEIEAIMNRLNEVQGDYDSQTNYPFSGFVKGLNLIKESGKTATLALAETGDKKKALEKQSDSEMTQGVKQIGAGAVEATQMISYLSDKMVELAETTGDTRLKEFAEELKSVSDLASATAQGASSGGWIGALVAAATSMITQTVESFVIVKAEIVEFQQNQIDFLNAYQGLLLEIKKEDYETVFGVSAFSMVAQATINARDALKKYNEELSKTSGYVFKASLPQGLINEAKTLMASYEKGYTDLQAMAVNIKDYSGWATIWGKRDEYKSLKDLAPLLWGEDGVFNVNAAKKFLETNTQISDAQRKAIQKVIDLKDAYEANLQIIRDDIKDTFGDLGAGLTDSIVEAIMTGADAFGLFEKAGDAAIERLGEKLMYELFFAEKFKQLQIDLENSYDAGDPQAIADAQLKLIDDFYANIGTDMENAQKWGEQWKEKAKGSGFDIWGDDASQNAASKGFQSMNQETGTELNGRFTALQMDTADIKINVSEMKGLTLLSLDHLHDINKNTKQLYQMNERLGKIESNTSKL